MVHDSSVRTHDLTDTASDPAGSPTACCRAVMIARVTNFAGLRRQLGRAAAAQVGGMVARRLQLLLDAERVTIVAQDLIELVLDHLNAAELKTAAAIVAGSFDGPEAMADENVVIELALGAAIDTAAMCDEVRLIEEAEAALTEAIRSGAPAIREIEGDGGKMDRATLSRDLVAAIRDDELRLHYQPKLHLRRQRIVGVEALIRWQHPTRGLIYPGDFIPLAEQTGDIAAMTLWAIRRVIADQQRLDERGHPLAVFVNIAASLLTDQSFVARACELIGESGRPIGFEITETSVIRDAQSAIANLQAFHAIGIKIAIDDYGAGLSSLAYLKQLPACELKIDKLFVTQLSSSHRDPLIVRSTIDLAHALEMQVVAEGVENHATLALLSVMGCDMAQGFLISRPLTIDRLLAFLDEHGEGWHPQSVPSPIALFAKRA
jgi:EAL domain-containing protein (putative c-di-GMP-specific phosphodiesterase class I)